MPNKLIIIQATPGAFEGTAYFIRGNFKVRLTPEQSLTFTLSHEAMHAFLRMLFAGIDKASEESFVQSVDKELLFYFEKNPSERPIPVRY